MNYTPILTWWFVIFIFGLIGWPLAFSLLRFLPDRGFALARPVGLLITGYLLWLGGSFRLMQNNIGGIITAMLLTLIAGLIWQRHLHRHDDGLTMLAWLQREWRYTLTVELLFAVAFAGWAIFKAYNPNIETAGGEKWMEIAFINGTLRSDYFPPHDPWLAGFAISYYYFGYVLMAMVTRLSGLVSHVAFNLYVPTLFAMTLTAALGIGANLVQLSNFKFQISNPDSTEDDDTQHSDLTSEPQIPGAAMLTGLLAALFVGIMGHLEGFLEVLHRRGLLSAEFWRWLDIRDLKVPPAGPGDSWLPDRFMWWWRGSRVLTDYTLTGHEQEVIDEFPFFSFLLADVHPHVLALPFVLLAVALALNLFANPAALPPVDAAAESIIDKIKQNLQNTWRMLTTAAGGSGALLVYAICIGGLSFLNTWDFPIYLGILGLSFTVWLFGRRPNWAAALQTGLMGTAMLGLGGILLYLPFYATFQSQARGILPNLWNPTRLPQFLIFFGPFIAAILVWLLMMSVRQKGWQKYIGLTLPFTILGPLMLMLTVLSGILISPAGREFVEGLLNNPEVQNILGDATISALVQESLWRRFQNPWVFLLLGGLLGWALALGLADNHVDADIAPQPADAPAPVIKFVLILLLAGLALPLAVEFMYLRDNFGIRMNTVFKFYFQAWVLLALVSAFAMYYVSQQLQGARRLGWRIGMDLLIAAGMVYPLLATADKTNYFQNEPTLNGIQWIADQRPDDFAGMAWLRANAPDNAIILEAPGSKYAAYQYTGRVSALTGLQTLLGWGGHQSQWRGNYDEPARREPDIDMLFNTVDVRQAQTLLDKYGIDYVYIGPLERERYAPAGLQKFERLMNIAFQQNNVTIYQR